MKKYIIYGISSVGKMLVKMLNRIKKEYLIFDGNPNLWGEYYQNQKIIPSIELVNYVNEEYTLILCIRDDQEKAFISYCSQYIEVISWRDVIPYLISEYENEVTYSTDYETNFKKWWFGLKSEIEFWEEAYAKPNGRKHNWYEKLIDNSIFNDEFFDVTKIKDGWKILDVGSGIVSRYGENLGGNCKIELTAVDPLAAWYNIFNKKYNPEYNKKDVKFGLLEELSEQFDNNSMDMIIISNALDHCISPLACIFESLKVIRIGGCIYIKTLIREACNEKTVGLHQWNLDLNDEGEFILWNEDSFVNISKRLNEFCEIVINRYPSDERGLSGNWGFMTICITKKKEIYEKKELEIRLTDSCGKIFNKIAKEFDYRDDLVWEEGYEAIFEKKHKIC